jgi:hypothetical protein|tara:strand:+ start:406 stop:966 length:561 start_codon:yes stop_codon:yes gene_type:complete
MLLGDMEILKEIVSEIPQKYFFIKAKIDIDSEYLIKKIEEGIKLENNLNYKTNVKGLVTSWDYFLTDEKFLVPLLNILNLYDDLAAKHHYFKKNYFLKDAWGIKENQSHYTMRHDHIPSLASGVIYLNKHPQKLHFHQINEIVDCFEGSFCLFSSFLDHNSYPWRNLNTEPRYGISFNLHEKETTK